MPTILVNIVGKETNIVKGRFPCSDYKICTEYLSTETSEFTVHDLTATRMSYRGKREPLSFKIANQYVPHKGDYLYVTKCDGSDIVPIRSTAFYVGVIEDISGFTIVTKSILTLLDVDSVVGMSGMFPAYTWKGLPGYQTGYGSSYTTTNRKEYAMYDCDTILSLIQSMEFALGQTPKTQTHPFSDFFGMDSNSMDGYFYRARQKLYRFFADFAGSNGYNSYYAQRYPGQGNGLTSLAGWNSCWWSNGSKKDILIDCPQWLLGLGRGDPNYFFDLLAYTVYYGRVKTERNASTGTRAQRYGMAKEDLPATYMGLGSGSKQMSVESLWTRLKKWYEEKHVMVLPVIYDSEAVKNTDAYRGTNDYNVAARASANQDTSQWKLVSRKGEVYSTPKTVGNASLSYGNINDWDSCGIDVLYKDNWVKFDKDFIGASSASPFGRSDGLLINAYDRPRTVKFNSANRFDEDNVKKSTAANEKHLLAYDNGSGVTNPNQFAFIGFKIVCMDYDLAYKYATDLFAIGDTTGLIGYSDSKYYRDKLFNFVPLDPNGGNVGSTSYDTARDEHCLPRGTKCVPNNVDGSTKGNGYSNFYQGYRRMNGVESSLITDTQDIFSGLIGEYYNHTRGRLCQTDQLRWCLYLDTRDPMIEAALPNGLDIQDYDLLLYKSTIGAISQQYNNDDTIWDFISRNEQPYGATFSKPYPWFDPEDDMLPVALLNSKDVLTVHSGGFSNLNKFTGRGVTNYYTNGSGVTRVAPLGKITAPVIPVVESKDNLGAFNGLYVGNTFSGGSFYDHVKSLRPAKDSSINFDIKIRKDIDPGIVNMWQVRPGQAVVLTLKNGTKYTNLRVFGVNISTDDDFFTLSVGANSPTIINEIERRTR